jgi:hypothetical protein
MIRLFWLGIWFVVELFSHVGIKYRTHKSVYKRGTPYHHVKMIQPSGTMMTGASYYQSQPNNGRIIVITPLSEGDSDTEMELSGGQVPYNRAPMGSLGIPGLSSPSSSFSHSSSPHSTTETVKGWYKLYCEKIGTDDMWLPSATWFPWISFIIYGLAFSAIFIFWYQSNDLPDVPQVDSWSNYDVVLLLFIINRLFDSIWSVSFWGSGGHMGWLVLGFICMLTVFVVGTTALVYLAIANNWLVFGLYIPFVVWVLFLLYFTGIFLATGYKLRPYMQGGDKRNM